MKRTEILEGLKPVFIKSLDIDNIILHEGSKADDIEEWDSLSHIQLVVAIEKKFKIRFNSREIQNWKNVGEMVDSIYSKVNTVSK